MLKHPLFSVVGIEIEYMLVHKNTLDVAPVSDLLLKELAGQFDTEFIFKNGISISNELVLHLIELKNTHPQEFNANKLKQQFQETIINLQVPLEKLNMQLLPTAQHPWMDPLKETHIWPHELSEIYYQFDKIFNCKAHGWSNLQSMHLNLPFQNDEEFNKLHNAIRLVLPLIPALAASSPFMENKTTGFLDSRLKTYSSNQQKIKEISGEIIPEFVQSEEQYEIEILQPMYQAIADFDAEGILQHPWLNSRGAIAKFDVGAIEIRVIDTQECVNADLSIALVLFELINYIVNESEAYLHNPISSNDLKNIFNLSIEQGFNTVINHTKFLSQLNIEKTTLNLRDVWSILIERIGKKLDDNSKNCIEFIINNGSLSERMLKIYEKEHNLKYIYEKLKSCLLLNEQLIT